MGLNSQFCVFITFCLYLHFSLIAALGFKILAQYSVKTDNNLSFNIPNFFQRSLKEAKFIAKIFCHTSLFSSEQFMKTPFNYLKRFKEDFLYKTTIQKISIQFPSFKLPPRLDKKDKNSAPIFFLIYLSLKLFFSIRVFFHRQ